MKGIGLHSGSKVIIRNLIFYLFTVYRIIQMCLSSVIGSLLYFFYTFKHCRVLLVYASNTFVVWQMFRHTVKILELNKLWKYWILSSILTSIFLKQTFYMNHKNQQYIVTFQTPVNHSSLQSSNSHQIISSKFQIFCSVHCFIHSCLIVLYPSQPWAIGWTELRLSVHPCLPAP